jgi:hypothetical protein
VFDLSTSGTLGRAGATAFVLLVAVTATLLVGARPVRVLTAATDRATHRPVPVTVARTPAAAGRVEVRARGRRRRAGRRGRRRRCGHCGGRTGGRATGGSGPGRSIARKLVEAHSGDIAAVSIPGAGSAFTVRLRARALL